MRVRRGSRKEHLDYDCCRPGTHFSAVTSVRQLAYQLYYNLPLEVETITTTGDFNLPLEPERAE